MQYIFQNSFKVITNDTFLKIFLWIFTTLLSYHRVRKTIISENPPTVTFMILYDSPSFSYFFQYLPPAISQFQVISFGVTFRVSRLEIVKMIKQLCRRSSDQNLCCMLCLTVTVGSLVASQA